jgi:Sulfotransferase domain
VNSSTWPNLFIVGAAKAGTTSLARYLDRHPDVYMSPMKEPHFFSRIEPDPRLAGFFPHIKDTSGYLALFSKSGAARVQGEASTSYLTHEHVPDAIKDVSPEAKIVIMLRNPISRAFSHYWNDVREGIENRSFAEAVEDELSGPPGRWGVTSVYVDCGFYAGHVERYLNVFGENVLVLLFEEFVADPAAHLERTLRFIGVDPAASTSPDFEAHNVFGLPRNAFSSRILASGNLREVARRVLPRGVRAYGRQILVVPAPRPNLELDVGDRLRNVYQTDVASVARLLDRRLPWPDFDPGT